MVDIHYADIFSLAFYNNCRVSKDLFTSIILKYRKSKIRHKLRNMIHNILSIDM